MHFRLLMSVCARISYYTNNSTYILCSFLNTVPAGLADLPHELVRAQKNWAAQHYTDIVSYTTYPKGGHFAAFEVPDLLAKDLRQFVQKVERRLVVQRE